MISKKLQGKGSFSMQHVVELCFGHAWLQRRSMFCAYWVQKWFGASFHRHTMQTAGFLDDDGKPVDAQTSEYSELLIFNCRSGAWSGRPLG